MRRFRRRGAFLAHQERRRPENVRPLVEVAPPFDVGPAAGGGVTSLAGATIAYELLCLLAETRAALRATRSAHHSVPEGSSGNFRAGAKAIDPRASCYLGRPFSTIQKNVINILMHEEK